MPKTDKWLNENSCPMKKRCHAIAVETLPCLIGEKKPIDCKLLQNLLVDYCFGIDSKCDICKYAIFCNKKGVGRKFREDRRRLYW